jgi:thioredoxin 1
MMTLLTPGNINEHIGQPGVAVINWRHPRSARSRLFDQELDRVARAHPDVRVGGVNVSDAVGLAQEHDVKAIPTLMVYRDGILVFSRPGVLPATLLEQLIQAVLSLDMEKVRDRVDGQGARLALVVIPGAEEPFPPGGGGANEPGAPTRH